MCREASGFDSPSGHYCVDFSLAACDLTSELITSASNPRVKFAASLRDAKGRRRHDRFLIDGTRNIAIALAAGVQCTEIFIPEQAWESPTHELLAILPEPASSIDEPSHRIRWTRLSEIPMRKLQYGEQDQQAIAMAIPPQTTLGSLPSRIQSSSGAPEHELYLVLDRLEKPGNLGAAMRTADAAGATAVLLSDPTAEVWNPNAIRASQGAMFTVPIAIGNWQDLFQWLMKRSVQCLAARTENGKPYSQIQFPNKTAIVIGSEANGLEDRWQAEEILPVHIPMFGKIDSLNASVTGSILLFEVIRQWQST